MEIVRDIERPDPGVIEAFRDVSAAKTTRAR